MARNTDEAVTASRGLMHAAAAMVPRAAAPSAARLGPADLAEVAHHARHIFNGISVALLAWGTALDQASTQAGDGLLDRSRSAARHMSVSVADVQRAAGAMDTAEQVLRGIASRMPGDRAGKLPGRRPLPGAAKRARAAAGNLPASIAGYRLMSLDRHEVLAGNIAVTLGKLHTVMERAGHLADAATQDADSRSWTGSYFQDARTALHKAQQHVTSGRSLISDMAEERGKTGARR